MKRKKLKFAEGGFSTAEGQNKNIGDDVRARALASVADLDKPDDSPAGKSSYGEENDMPEVKSITKTTVAKTPAKTLAKPKVDIETERKRIEDIGKKQGLKTVNPEMDFIPAAKIAAGASALYGGARMLGKYMLGKRAAKEATKEAAKKTLSKEASNTTSRIAKNDAAEAAVRARAAKVRSKANDDAETALRVRAAKVRGKANDEASKKVRERAKKRDNLDDFDDGGSGAFKRGGSVSSASRRADGCAVRGKTRA